jgi:hypothetical protein
MEKKVNAILFKFLPNATHYGYTLRVKETLDTASDAVKNVLGNLPQDFVNWHKKEFALMEWVRRSALTEQIAEADHRMDLALVALRTLVHAMEYSLTTNIAEAAHRVSIMLNSYGKSYTKPYDTEIGDMSAILAQLNDTYKNDIITLGLLPQCTELYGAYTEFRTLFEQRGTETLKKPAENFVEVRRGEDAVYYEIVERVNAGAVMGVDDGFAAIIDKLNPEIEHLNNQFHRARKDIGAGNHTVVEPIDTQTYTGRPITIVPKVHYREEGKETKNLSLGKDFSVSYRNNTEVGMAECIIHGKGNYTGPVSVPFNIERQHPSPALPEGEGARHCEE